MATSVRFDVRVEDRTEITANEDEISMGMKVVTHIGRPKLINGQDMAQAMIQQFGKRAYGKKLKIGVKI